MSTITANSLINELTKLKTHNEELRKGNQALIKEKDGLIRELGKANTERQKWSDRVAELEPLQAQLEQQKQESDAARTANDDLVGRAAKAEEEAARAAASLETLEETTAALIVQFERLEDHDRHLLTEVERHRAEIEALEPYRNAVMAFKRVLK